MNGKAFIKVGTHAPHPPVPRFSSTDPFQPGSLHCRVSGPSRFSDTSRPIRWSALAADRLQPDMKEAIRRAHEAVDRICRTAPEEITYENTFGALEEVNVSLTEPMAKAYALKSLCDSDSIRKAMDEATPLAVAFHSSLTKNQSLWNTLKTAHARLGDAVADPERKRYMELCMQSFRDNGADLPPGKRARLEVIDRELALCAQRFNNLYMDARKNWGWTVRDADALDGLSRTTLRQAAQEFRSRHPGETGPGWTFTLDSAAAGRVMEKVRSEKIRKDLWEHLQTLATDSYDTEPVVRQMLSLRSEKAQLCGYRTYSDYALQQSMAGNGEEAMRFVNGLLDRVKEPFFREMESLRQAKARLTGNKEVRLHPWDTAYYANLQAEERFRLDREELRHYFPLPRVMAGLFGVAEQLYGIRVTELPVRKPLTGISGPEKGGEAEVWNPDVRFFAIDDGKEERLGYFYLDIFARSNKRAGAWMSPLDAGAPPADGRPGKPRLGMVCLNVQKPADGEPVLLSHREVRILFHEFGHLLHLMFSRVSIPSLSGTNVPQDFVEVPSQFMENWCSHPDILRSFARHERTGQPIPEDMLRSLEESRGNTPAITLVSQLLYAKTDLAVHMEPERFAAGSLDDADSIVAGDLEYFKDCRQAGRLRTARHLFASSSGYASFYFSYRWAEVLDKDIFEAFEHSGLLNRETAGKFRKAILEKGFTVPPMQQFTDFMGRKPNMDAMLRKRRLTS